MIKHKHLLIDGYNVIHAFGINITCAHLANMARYIHDVEGLRTTIVLDGKGTDISIERPGEDLTFSLLYTSSDISADGVIEQFVYNNNKKQTFIVVSRDNLLIETVSTLGAIPMNPNNFKTWVQQCQQRQKEKLYRQTEFNKKKWKQESPWDKLL